MVETKDSKDISIPEPPKFNLKDLPEPPKINAPLPPKITSSTVPSQPVAEEPKPEFQPAIPPPVVEEPKPALQQPDLLKDLSFPPLVEKPQKKGFFGFLKKKEKPKQELPLPPLDIKKDISAEPVSADAAYMPPPPMFEETQNSEIPITKIAEEPKLNLETVTPSSAEEEKTLGITMEREQEMLEEGEHFKEKEMLEEGERYLAKSIPLAHVKGIGPAREKKLKKLGIKTAQHLAQHDYKALAKRADLPESHARELIKNAKKLAKVARIKKDFEKTKVKEEKGITEVIKELEEERKQINLLEKKGDVTEEKIIELEGHHDLIKVLEALEKKRKQLLDMEQKLAEKENSLANHDENYKKDMQQIESLRKKLDEDVKERTQYLINMEKEYFQKAQTLAKKQSDVEMKEKELAEKEKLLKEREATVKPKAAEIQERMHVLESKEKKYEKMMQSLEKQDMILKEREDDLLKREAEYMKKLDMLETHEKGILKQLEMRRKNLETKEKEVSARESRLYTKQRNVDKKSVAVEYAQNILEEQKGKLVDDEFEQYLHEQLGLIKNTGISMEDINITKNVNMPSFDKSKNIYQLVDTCRDMLKTNRVGEAKIFYNQIRDKYYGSNFGNQKEKEAVHNLVRSLYDEINLADIGRNR